jgi:2-haloacid dehalogenase
MKKRPDVLIFDVNETLSDLSALRQPLEDLGIPGERLTTWFSNALRDGFALTAAGGYADFAEVARSAATSLFAGENHFNGDPGSAAERLVSGFGELPLHGDVKPCFERLHSVGLRVVTLTNGSRSDTESLLEHAGIERLVELNLSVHDIGRWKPASGAYHYALACCGVEPQHAMLISAHPWDVDGAKRAGLQGAWINRGAEGYSSWWREPELISADLGELADALATPDLVIGGG